jgi:hypothetical protein
VGIYKDGTEDLHKASSSSSLVGDDSVTCQPGHDDMTINQSSDSLVIEKPLLKIVAKKVLQKGVQGQSSAHGRSLLLISSKSALHQLKAMCSSNSAKMNSVHKQLLVALDKLTKDSEITVRAPLPSGAEQRETSTTMRCRDQGPGIANKSLRY